MSVSAALNRSPDLSLAAARVAEARPAQAQAGLLSRPLTTLAAVAVVAMLTMLSVQFGVSPNGVVVMWMPSAVAAAAWLRCGRGRTFDLTFGVLMTVAVFTGELLAGYDFDRGLIVTAANMVEIVAVVMLARRFAPGQDINSVRGLLRLSLVLMVLGPLVGAVAGSVALNIVKATPLLIGFQTWWFGHAVGLMMLTPLLLSIDRRSSAIFQRPQRVAEWVVLIGLVGVAAYVVNFRAAGPAAFMLNTLLVVIAARLRAPGVSLAMLIAAFMTFAAMLHGAAAQAPAADLAHQIINTQLRLVSVVVPFLLVSALLHERDVLMRRAYGAQNRAERASEAKSRLLANVAHEIKSPVAGVIGIGELWSGGQLGPVTPQQREMADMLVKTARQVETLAHDLLDVARAESGAVKVELRPTDLRGVLEDVRRSVAMRGESRNIVFDVVCEDESLVALADSQRLTQVIDNFATNAVKYGHSGGMVTFRGRRVGDNVRVEVSDRGPGMSPDKQAQLFEPFNRLGLERSTVEGHGIGLALSKRLVELQGGAIGVDSVVGEGATFWVELPAA